MTSWKAILTALAWPAAGAAAGATMGVLWSRPESVSGLFIPLFVGLVVVAGAGVALWKYQDYRAREGDVPVVRASEKPAAKPKRKPATSEPTKPEAAPETHVRVRFPEIGDDLPDVWGVGDALRIHVTSDAEPGTTVKVYAGARKLNEGEAGDDGGFPAAVRFDQPGKARIRAEVGGATDERVLRIVDYGEEIVQRVDRFRVWAMENVPGCRDALTLREVSDAVSASAGSQAGEAIVEIVRIYELVSYGERVADRTIYVDLVQAFQRLEAAGIEPQDAAVPKEA